MNNIESCTGEIVMYQPDETIRLEVRMEGETVWLSQAQMAELFGTKRPAITKHLNNIYKCGELKEESTCSILEHMGNDGKQLYTTRYYNLDAIISVGFRVNTKRGIEFRQWAKIRGQSQRRRQETLRLYQNARDPSSGTAEQYKIKGWFIVIHKLLVEGVRSDAHSFVLSSRPPPLSSRAQSRDLLPPTKSNPLPPLCRNLLHLSQQLRQESG